LKKFLNINFFVHLVAFLIIFGILLWYHYSWGIALLNSIAVVIVYILLEKPIQKMNKNRKRYFPRWLWTIIVIFIFSILTTFSNFSKLELLWIIVLGDNFFKIIFPVKPES
jgi:chromate transport protein ChrA